MRLRALLLVAALASVLVGLPAAAAESTATTAATAVTLVSEFGDVIGKGADRLYDGEDAVELRRDPDYPDTLVVQVTRDGGDHPDYELRFAPPPGERLRPRAYEGVVSPYDRTGPPGLGISGDGSACNRVTGRFVVLDIAYSGDAVERLHLLYEHHCEGVAPALFGEVRYRMPVGEPGLVVAPAQAMWPLSHDDVPVRPVPVTVHNAGAEPVTLGAARIDGESRSAFGIHDDACPSRLEAGGSCVVYVEFDPAGPGRHTATLTVPDSTAAGSRSVALSGEAAPGAASWRMHSDPRDVIGQGRSYAWTPDNAVLTAKGNNRYLIVEIDAPDGHYTAHVTGSRDQLLESGRTFEGARRAEHSFPDPGLSISRPDRLCDTTAGRFTIHELVAGNEHLERFSLTFEQRCEGSDAVLRGSIAYRATQPVPPVPGEPRARFTDAAGDAHERSIVAVADRGIAGGYSDGSYRPAAPVDRGQAATFLARTVGLPRTSAAGVPAPHDRGSAGADGSTSWRMRLEPGPRPHDPWSKPYDPDGRSFDWTPANATIQAGGSQARIRVDVSSGPDSVTAELRPGRNRLLLPGRTYERAGSTFQSLTPSMDVGFVDRYCERPTSQFTVHEIAFTQGRLERLSLTFVERCKGGEQGGQPLRGSITYRAEQPPRPIPGEPDPAARFSDIAGNVHLPGIEAVGDEGIAAGFSDGTYRPRLSVSRGQLATLLARSLALPPAPPAGFRDTAGSPHEAAIDAVAAAGIAGGYGDGSFRPDAVVSRGQLATFLVRADDRTP